MEEIKFDFSNIANQNSMVLFDYIIKKASKEGVQLGISWDKEVYDYLFENNPRMIDIDKLLGLNTLEIELQGSVL